MGKNGFLLLFKEVTEKKRVEADFFMDKGFLGTILLDTHNSAGLGSTSIRARAEIS